MPNIPLGTPVLVTVADREHEGRVVSVSDRYYGVMWSNGQVEYAPQTVVKEKNQ